MDSIDELVAAVDPMRGALVTQLDIPLREELKNLTPQESAQTQPPRSRRRRLTVVSLVAAACLALPAAAIGISAAFHTGIFAGDEETEQTPGEELLNLSDPSIVGFVRAEASKVPLPPGETFDAVVARYPIEEPTIGQRGVIVGELQHHAQCIWYRNWLEGDADTRAGALTVIEQFPSWEFVKYFAPGDPGPRLVRETVDQVRRGEETMVRQFMLANC
jgi:hypothetical protein